MTSIRFAYIWQYVVDSHRREFLDAYGAGGEWVKLFSRDPNYIETVLLRDANDEHRYITIDYWTSRSARDAFQNTYRDEFLELDKRCAEFTSKEGFLGDFDLVGSSDA
jgi:heme-degrading monooxygenase HmoA